MQMLLAEAAGLPLRTFLLSALQSLVLHSGGISHCPDRRAVLFAGAQNDWDAFAGGESAKPAAGDDWMSGFGASSNGAGSAAASSDPFGQPAGPAALAATPGHAAVCFSLPCTIRQMAEPSLRKLALHPLSWKPYHKLS